MTICRDAIMSPLKLNSLLIGIFLAIFVAVESSTMAQDGLRLWKPYSSESFGGGRRGNDGVYGSLSGIYWSISTPKGGYIGATTVKGDDEIRWVWDQQRTYAQTNSVKIEMVSPTTTLGTRFEVGNRRGHHGWLVSGYGLPGQGHDMSVQNVSVAIRDEGNLNYLSNLAPLAGTLFRWDRTNNTVDWTPIPRDSIGVMIPGLGYLWGYFDYLGGPDVDGDGESDGVGIFAPLPIFFENAAVNIRSTHYSGELMYTYRAHPFTWGSMELLAGARYWEFKDSFGFTGTNWAGVDTGTGTGTGTGGTGTGTTASSLLMPRTGLRGMVVDAEGNNYVFGPQAGIKLSRQNARWTFGAEGRFTAGINAQTVKTQGSLLPRVVPITEAGDGAGGVGGPISLQNSNHSFGHKQTKCYFSPILEGRLSADWQWTNAVGFFGAVNGMFADNIARGVRVTDYVVHSDGTIFGIRGNDRNTHVFVYGVEAGIKVKR